LTCPLQKAITKVKEATELDTAEKYPEALKMYLEAIEYFMHAIKCTSRTTRMPPSHTDVCLLIDEK